MENTVKSKSFRFAVRVVKLSQYLTDEKKEYTLSKQLLRSGTAVGALYREAEHAESTADFIHKLAIAQKECNETLYWLELHHATEYLTESEFSSIHQDALELKKMITAIIKTTKRNL
ncbi:MAG TPA: four helix bundle protein [Cytophagales bacterium]|nr:four helix bundle protein [Cytophagales bacterium]HAA18737.1 four helix bundle protein [Cytophagales bacterium]HAP58770.1 four helix bundle protein [Cytophagales bacterium]